MKKIINRILSAIESAYLNWKLDRMSADMEIAIENLRQTNAINQRMIERAGIILAEMKVNYDHPEAGK